jgi:hypothetical protein
LAACHALVAQLEEHRFRKPGVAGSNPAEGTRCTDVSLPWPRGEAPERHSGQCGFESRQQLNGLVVQRENPRLAPERPGFESRRVHFLFSFGSVAQLDESTRLRAVGSQVRVLPGPLHFCPCSSVEQSARLRPVRPQVRILPRALQASVAQWMKSGRVLSARSQVRVLPGAQLQTSLLRSGAGRPTGSHTPGFQGSTPCSATSHARRASWRRRRSHTPVSLGSIPRACTQAGVAQ